MQFSNYALDMVATRLSQFTDPEIPELQLRDDKTLQNNMLESMIGMFSGAANTEVRHLMTNVVRRAFAAMEMYRLGRKHALEYAKGPRDSRLSPYFVALTYFESCASYCWQAGELARKSSSRPFKLFENGDGSAWERLHRLHSVGTKHSYNKYDAAQEGEMPTTVWLTNSGIACLGGAPLTYAELAAIIVEINDIFYDVQARVVAERAQQAATPAAQEESRPLG